MSEKKKIVLAVVITAVVTATLSCIATDFIKDNIAVFFATKDKEKAFHNKLSMIDSILENKYLYDYDKDELRENAVKAYVKALGEPYTEYYTKDEFTSYMANTQDGYVGIGVIVGVDENNQIVVVAPTENSASFKAGIQPNDIIKAVDGVEYCGNEYYKLLSYIKNGKSGESLSITVLRNGTEEITFDVARENIAVDSVRSEMLEDNVGYIRITEFNTSSADSENSTYTEFKDNFEQLKNNGMEKLIIDLRDNPGGILEEVCGIADMLLPEGTIMYTESKNGTKKIYSSDAECVNMPIVVLINENSASASELLTGALKDYNVAEVVGTKSYGKGIVQNIYRLFDGSGISITALKYYTPNGVCIQDVGIEPDVTVEMPEKYSKLHVSLIPRDEDVQLNKALEIIKEK